MMEDGLEELPELRSQATHEILDGLHCSLYFRVLILLGRVGTGELLYEEG